MSMKDAVRNGNAAMKEAAMKSLSTEAADSAESSARRTARAGARREVNFLYAEWPQQYQGGLGAWEASERNPMCEWCTRVAPPVTESGQTLGCRGRSACWEWHRQGACGQHRWVKARCVDKFFSV